MSAAESLLPTRYGCWVNTPSRQSRLSVASAAAARIAPRSLAASPYDSARITPVSIGSRTVLTTSKIRCQISPVSAGVSPNSGGVGCAPSRNAMWLLGGLRPDFRTIADSGASTSRCSSRCSTLSCCCVAALTCSGGSWWRWTVRTAVVATSRSRSRPGESSSRTSGLMSISRVSIARIRPKPRRRAPRRVRRC